MEPCVQFKIFASLLKKYIKKQVKLTLFVCVNRPNLSKMFISTCNQYKAYQWHVLHNLRFTQSPAWSTLTAGLTVYWSQVPNRSVWPAAQDRTAHLSPLPDIHFAII